MRATVSFPRLGWSSCSQVAQHAALCEVGVLSVFNEHGVSADQFRSMLSPVGWCDEPLRDCRVVRRSKLRDWSRLRQQGEDQSELLTHELHCGGAQAIALGRARFFDIRATMLSALRAVQSLDFPTRLVHARPRLRSDKSMFLSKRRPAPARRPRLRVKLA